MRRLGELTERMQFRGKPGLGLRYGRVFFVLRERLGLSAIDCLLLDVVDTLSRRTGWSYASRSYLAGLLGVSPRSLQRIITRLKRRGLLEARAAAHRQLRPTVLWRRAKLSITSGQPGASGPANLSSRYQERYKN